MYNKKMLLTQHHWPLEAGVVKTPGRAGSGNILNIRTLCVKWQFFLHCQKKIVKGWFLKLGCHFFSKWHCIKCSNICTTGQVLKIDNIYTYKEDSDIDIVRLTDVLIERGYLYCSLFFFSKNEIITVRHTMQKGTYVLWRLMDKEEYEELMSRKLWYEVTKHEELLEFDF